MKRRKDGFNDAKKENRESSKTKDKKPTNKKRKNNWKKLSVAEKLLLSMRYFFITLILLAIVYYIQIKAWEGLFVAFLTLIMLLLPTIFSRTTKIVIPTSFQIFITLFIFASMYLGELKGYYKRYSWWDSMLHSTSAVVLGYIGFLLIYALNRNQNMHLTLSPFFIALFTFCFAITTGVIWEIFEFSVDEFLGYDMQKARNLVDHNGEPDTRLGVKDTMKDLIVDSLGALFVAALGYYYCTKKMVKTKAFWRLRDEFFEDNIELFDKESPPECAN